MLYFHIEQYKCEVIMQFKIAYFRIFLLGTFFHTYSMEIQERPTTTEDVIIDINKLKEAEKQQKIELLQRMVNSAHTISALSRDVKLFKQHYAECTSMQDFIESCIRKRLQEIPFEFTLDRVPNSDFKQLISNLNFSKGINTYNNQTYDFLPHIFLKWLNGEFMAKRDASITIETFNSFLFKFIDYGGNINLKDEQGNTLLHRVARLPVAFIPDMRFPLFKSILKLGGDPNIENKQRLKVLDIIYQAATRTLSDLYSRCDLDLDLVCDLLRLLVVYKAQYSAAFSDQYLCTIKKFGTLYAKEQARLKIYTATIEDEQRKITNGCPTFKPTYFDLITYTYITKK